MSVPSRHHSLINACISNALQDALQCQSEQADCARPTVDDVLQASRAIESLVQAAIAQFHTDWNAAHGDLVLRLPTELAFECFDALDFNGRLAVSHVSRAWRSLALSDVRLWSSVDLLRKTPSVALDMVESFLHRSNPMPFAVISQDLTGDVPSTILDLIARHMHRMEYLEFARLPSNSIMHLFAQKADILKTLVIYSPCVLPADWGEDRAPCLENLQVGPFQLPVAFQPIRTLRAFTGYLHHGLSDSFFRLFPRVTSLDLHAVGPQNLGELDILPLSVTSLSLHSAPHHHHLRILDYSPCLPTLKRLALSYLYIRAASPVSDIVQLFVQKTQGERRMSITWRGNLELESDANNVRFDICTVRLSFAREPALLTPLRAFSALSIPLELLMDVYNCLGEQDRTFSCVRSFTVILDWSDKFEYLRVLYEPGIRSPINISRLQALSFEARFRGYTLGAEETDSKLERFASRLGQDLPDALPLLLSYPTRNVEYITMQTEHPNLLLRCGLGNLQRLAPRLKIRNLRTLEVTEIQYDDSDESIL